MIRTTLEQSESGWWEGVVWQGVSGRARGSDVYGPTKAITEKSLNLLAENARELEAHCLALVG